MGAYNIVSPNAMIAGQPEDISVVLANFQAIAAVLNGGIDNSNLALAASIAASKLAGYPADNTKMLAGDGTWPSIPSGFSFPGIATTLPGSPADKQVAIYGDSVSAPTYVWFLQYNATAAKWYYLGGSPQYAFVATTSSKSNSNTLTDPATNCSLTVVRAGAYKIDYSCMFERGPSASGSGGNMIRLSIAGVDDANTQLDYYGNANTNGGTTDVPLSSFYETGALAAASVIKFRYQGASDNTVKIFLMRLGIVPVYVT